ncbi:MAG: MFS transporter [Clostridia bacterium]|nr:MFS transporter [Clostridia bacterium]
MKRSAFWTNPRAFLHEHYHWVIAAVTFLMLFLYGGAANNLTSLHIIPVSEALGISRSTFSFTHIAQTVTGMLATFFSGFIIARFGTRATSTAGLLGAIGAYLLFAEMQSVWMLALGRGILGFATGFCSTGAASHVTRVWFHRHGGTVLGIITAATGIGGSVMCIFQTAFMEKGGFAASFRFCTVACAVAAALVLLLIRNAPKDIGLLPLGDGEEVTGKRRKSLEKIAPGLPMKTLVKRPAFYLMGLCTLLTSLCIYMAYSFITPYLVDCGFSTPVAAGFHSAMLLILTATKVLIGFLSDHLGARRVVLACTLLAALGLSLFGLVGSLTVAVVAVILYTCALPMVTIGTSLIAFSLFGSRAQAQYTGIFLSIITISNFLGDYASNLIHDLFGSYRPAFFLAGILSVLCFFLFLLLYRLADKDLQRPDAM